MLKIWAKIFKEIVFQVIERFKITKIIFLIKINNQFLEVDLDHLVQIINLNNWNIERIYKIYKI